MDAELQRLQQELDEKRRRCAQMYPPPPPLKSAADAAAELLARVEVWRAEAAAEREAHRARVRASLRVLVSPPADAPAAGGAMLCECASFLLTVSHARAARPDIPARAWVDAARHRDPAWRAGETHASVSLCVSIAESYAYRPARGT